VPELFQFIQCVASAYSSGSRDPPDGGRGAVGTTSSLWDVLILGEVWRYIPMGAAGVLSRAAEVLGVLQMYDGDGVWFLRDRVSGTSHNRSSSEPNPEGFNRLSA